MSAPPVSTQLHVVDWRRRVQAIYAEVRTLATTDPAGAHAYWSAARDELFAHHPSSPVLDRAAFTGLRVAPYDPAWRFEVTIGAADPAIPDAMVASTGTDGEVSYRRLGAVAVPGVGSLDVWWHEGYGGGIFVPVRDGAAGRLTYGGGRYLLDTTKGADLGFDPETGSLVLDLNFAYNPSCVYDPAWACPLPRAGNTVPVEVPVGELLP